MKKKSLTVGIILVFIGTCIIPAMAQDTEKPLLSSRGNTLYVGGSGPGNYSKIQDAINNSHDGDTIFVYSGIYKETIVIPVSITLQGEMPTTTIIQGKWNRWVIQEKTNNIKIIGFTLTGSNIGVYIGSNAHHTEIAFNIITGENVGIKQYMNINGSNNSIHHNVIKNNNRGIELSSATYNKIFNNTFQNTYDGILLWSSSDYNTIYNNRFSDRGLDIEESHHNKVYNNTIDGKPIVYLENEKDKVVDHAGQVIIYTSDNITIRDCYFDKPSPGIHLSGTKNCHVTNNTFTSISSGCYIDYTVNTFIEGNIFYNVSCGLHGWQCINTVFRFNNFSYCDYGIVFEFCALRTKILRNNFIRNSRDLVLLLSVVCTVRQNYWNESRTLPKIIFVGEEFLLKNRIVIDWFPAQEPYEIGG
jgi:parallel beta-helix repeat protein